MISQIRLNTHRVARLKLLWRTGLIVALCSGIACSLTAASESGPPRPGRRILFIGNSLTYVNSLPLVVEAMADSAGVAPLSVETVAFPNYSLSDHVVDGSAIAAIDRGGWELVVLQQGSSALDASRVELRQFTRFLSDRIRGVNARPALYMVWPSEARQFDFDRVIESYRLAAEDVDGLLFPVGTAWVETWKRDPAMPLYAGDGLHPSAYGTYLAAAVMYATLYGKSPIGLPARLGLRGGEVLGIPSAQAAVLQAAAAEVTGTTAR